MKEINIINRLGNKQSDIKYFKHFLPLDLKTVIEPFGGSFGVIRTIYNNMNLYNLHINDTDPTLLYLHSLQTVYRRNNNVERIVRDTV